MTDLFHVDQATADRWRADGRFVLFGEGEWPKMCPHSDPTECNGEHCDCPLRPPAAMIEAAQPCETCGDDRVVTADGQRVHTRPVTERWIDCPDCKGDGQRRHPITVPCSCGGTDQGLRRDGGCHLCYGSNRISTGLLAIVEFGPTLIDDRLVTAGDSLFVVTGDPENNGLTEVPPDLDPASLVGQWAIGGRIFE